MRHSAVNQKSRPPVYDWRNIVQLTLYPPHCRLCGDRGAPGLDLCAACLAGLPYLGPGCRQCASPLAADGLYCGDCLRQSPAFDRVLAPLRYTEPVDALIQALKFSGSLAAGRLLGELLLRHLLPRQAPLPQLLLPVPLHPQRLRQRGYNQAVELARPLSAALAIPMATALLRRSRATRVQSELPAAARRANVRQAFSLGARRLPRHVAIVDDVMTTGHTVNEIARLLRRAGARRVEVWVVARALPRRTQSR